MHHKPFNDQTPLCPDPLEELTAILLAGLRGGRGEGREKGEG